MKSKWLRRFAKFIFIFALCGAAFWSVRKLWFDPYRGTVTDFRPSEQLEAKLSAEQAVHDLDYIVQLLAERHPACINGLPDRVRTQYEREREHIASSEATVLSLWQSAARVLSSLGDAHTSVGVKYESEARLPINFVWENDALLCSGGDYDGYAVIKVNNIPIEDLYWRFLGQFSYELEAWARYSFDLRLNRGEYLSFLGVDANEGVRFELQNPKDGRAFTAVFMPSESAGPADEKIPNFDYSVDRSAGVGIFALYRCINDEEYKAGLRKFFTEVKEQNVHSVIVDLRGNPGGNSQVADEFLRYLPAESYLTGTVKARIGPFLRERKPKRVMNQKLSPTFDGDLYLLTGANTFSAAMDFAVLISDNGLGTIVGESPGNMPSSYGDVLRFQTPDAGLVFTVSYKYFVRPDLSKADLPLIPDLQIPADDALIETMRLIEKAK